MSIQLRNFLSDNYIEKKSLEHENPQEYISDLYKCGRKVGGGLLINTDSETWKEFYKKYDNLNKEKRLNNAKNNLLKNQDLKAKLNLKEKIKSIPKILQSIINDEVSTVQMMQRISVCEKCPYLSYHKEQLLCGVCGCWLNPNVQILNLLQQKETHQNVYCKHPDGSQWLKNGC